MNAVAHNDWKSKVSPAVYVFSNRIEIISTGVLHFDEEVLQKEKMQV